MIEAIRTLGILKMIDEFEEEFNSNALMSVDSFLDKKIRDLIDEKVIQERLTNFR